MTDNLAALKQYPMDTKCVLCGKTRGTHSATGGFCPIGKRGRAGVYSYSTIKHFVPKKPRVPKQIREALTSFHAAAIRQVQAGESPARRIGSPEYLAINQALDLATWRLLTAIQEHCNDKPTKRNRPIIV